MGLERIFGSDAGMAADVIDIEDRLSHTPAFSGDIWFVDAAMAVSGDGTDPHTAFRTVGEAVAAATAGDAITVKQGLYAEHVDLNLTGLELWGEIGAIIQRLTLSGMACRARDIIVSPTATVGVAITGNFCILDNVRVDGTPTIAFDIDGLATEMSHCNALGYTVTAYDINADACIIRECFAVNVGYLTRGFYLSNASADGNLLRSCISSGNAIAGFETVVGTAYNVFDNCVSGRGDGDWVDAGAFNSWPNFSLHTDEEHHEETYPYFAGEGAVALPVTIDNTVTDDSGGGPWSDKDFWGDVVRVIAPNILALHWFSLGIYIYAVTANDIQPWQIFFANPNYMASRNGGNVWDYQETVLTVDDGNIFEVSDKVWITGTGTLDGEICDVTDVTGDVITIASETRKSADTGLKNDYAGAEKMYVVARSFTHLLDGFRGDFSAGSAKDFLRIIWNERKLVPANAGMIMRMANSSDDLDSSFEVRAIYES